MKKLIQITAITAMIAIPAMAGDTHRTKLGLVTGEHTHRADGTIVLQRPRSQEQQIVELIVLMILVAAIFAPAGGAAAGPIIGPPPPPPFIPLPF